MELERMEVTATYSKRLGKNTLRVQLWQHPGEVAHLHILTTGSGGSGDAIIDAGTTEELFDLIKAAESDFLKRFEFKEEY